MTRSWRLGEAAIDLERMQPGRDGGDLQYPRLGMTVASGGVSSQIQESYVLEVRDAGRRAGPREVRDEHDN